jgi:hypothetical protein
MLRTLPREVSDDLWELGRPSIPLPRELGASSTLHDRFQEWAQVDFFKALRQADTSLKNLLEPGEKSAHQVLWDRQIHLNHAFDG